MNINNGKTNGGEGHKLYGRAMRAANVSHCALGSFGFYTMARFELTHEFDEECCPDFTKNSDWYPIKLLIGLEGDHKKEMANNTYDSGIRGTLKRLGIASNHIVHIGRILGASELALAEVPEDDIRIIGNWQPSVRDKSYSIKLPIKAMRNMAGFENGSFLCPRSELEPPKVLKDMIFPFASTELAKVEAAVRAAPRRSPGNLYATALNFLGMLVKMKTIILQDAAAMLVEYPERATHPLLGIPAVFQHPRFMVNYTGVVFSVTNDTTNTDCLLPRNTRNPCDNTYKPKQWRLVDDPSKLVKMRHVVEWTWSSSQWPAVESLTMNSGH